MSLLHFFPPTTQARTPLLEAPGGMNIRALPAPSGHREFSRWRGGLRKAGQKKCVMPAITCVEFGSELSEKFFVSKSPLPCVQLPDA